MKNAFVLSLLLLSGTLLAQSIPDSIRTNIDQGNFTLAQSALQQLIETAGAADPKTLDYAFEIERMDRIRKDFPKTEEQVVKALNKYYPNITPAEMRKFESDGSLEMKMIDGQRRYFSYAVQNLFRINKEAKNHKVEIDGPAENVLTTFLGTYLPSVVAEYDKTKSRLLLPEIITLNYTLTVHPDAVPDGEIIRCWLPFPREDRDRQSDVRLLSMSEKNYIIADKSQLQRTVYAEKKAVKGQPTVFRMSVQYRSASDDHHVGEPPVTPGLTLSADSVKEFTQERPPHIVFTDSIKQLSQEIVGTERDPLKKARLIFTWISTHIPWASAREYSTIPNISSYCLANKHGDCGIQSLLFMTLARYNGIPAKWESGWMLHEVEVNLHDWSEIFLDGYGWVPVDQSFGLQASADARVKYYYLGGIDAYRLIVNDDFGRDLYPAKVYPRSETVDFQRGEVEWRGGNLYFDKWSYKMDVDRAPLAKK
jgi:transglutaminase-like putative cysteine protease